MPKTIIVSDVKPISLTISADDDGRVNLSVRFLRLDTNGDEIEGYVGILSTEVTGNVKIEIVNFVQTKVVPWIKQQEGIT